jgi:hypothetical protein
MQTICIQHVIEGTPSDTGANCIYFFDGIYEDTVDRRDVDDDAIVQYRVAGSAMATSSPNDAQVLEACKLNRRHDVRHVRAVSDEERILVERIVALLPSGIVTAWSCPCNSGHADTVRLMAPQRV